MSIEIIEKKVYVVNGVEYDSLLAAQVAHMVIDVAELAQKKDYSASFIEDVGDFVVENYVEIKKIMKGRIPTHK